MRLVFYITYIVVVLFLICHFLLFNRTDYYKSKIHPWGFIMVRCVQNELTSQYWLKSYDCIRKLYPEIPIVIIDDNSNPDYINNDMESNLYQCQIIKSEYPQRGEMLGYFYFMQKHWFDKAVVIHDSVFIKKRMDFHSHKNVKFLWHFGEKKYDDVEMETQLLQKINGPYMDLYADKNKWKGCFGLMSVIDHDFLVKISYMFLLMDHVNTRRHRSCMERIFAVMCFHHYPELMDNISIMGDIHQYALPWGFDYQSFIQHENNERMPSIVKVWTGR